MFSTGGDCSSLAVHSHFVCSFDFVFTDTTTVYAGMRMCWKGDLERWLLAQVCIVYTLGAKKDSRREPGTKECYPAITLRYFSLYTL